MIYVLFKLIQERKLMKRSYYIYNNGMLKRQDNSIAFVDENGEKRYIPIETVNEIYVMSEMDFNTNLINYLSQYGVVIHFFNYYSFYTGTFQPREKLVSGNLLVNQVNHYTDNEKRLDIAKRFIDGASFNIYRNLRYYNGRGKDVQIYMDKIEELRKQIPKSKSIQELMGYEGNIEYTWGNSSAAEMVRRFWETVCRGGYPGHGETYLHPENILWWSHGGKLHGESWKRIKFLKKIMEETPGTYLKYTKRAFDEIVGIPYRTEVREEWHGFGRGPIWNFSGCP